MHFLIKSALAAMMPSIEGLSGIETTALDDFVRRFRRESGALIWLGAVLGTLVFTFGPLLTIGVPLPSFWLSDAQLERHAQRIMGHRIYLLRQAVFLLKMLAGLCWGQDPKIRAALGLPAYAGDPGTWRTS